MYFGLYEYELAPYVREFCGRGLRCFDIGGFDGYYALVFARLTRSDVIVFDSDQKACERIKRNCDRNPELSSLVQIRNAYVAFESNLRENCVALDDCLRKGEFFAPDVIKLDVDGAELSVLTGAKRLLAKRRPHMIVETHSPDLERASAQMLCELGYRPRIVTPRRWLAQDRPLAHNRWLVARGGD
jgi:hypothetical protein